jgi:YD repeat-containing protein
MVEAFISQNDAFIKTCIEEYKYDTTYRLIEITYTALSEETNRWIESTQALYYNDQNQVIKSVIPNHHEQCYYYDGSGNLVKEELYPLYPVEYEGPITRTYTFDNHKNPFYGHDTRFFLPLGNANIATQLSLNNVLAWESYSPETGDVVAKSTIEYVYNAHEYPSSATETVLSPLTDPEPGTILWYTEYEYGLN